MPKFPLHQPTLDLLKGLQGIELGAAAHNPFGVDALNVAPEEQEDFYAQAQRNLCGEAAKVDVYAYASDLWMFEDDSVDFVLSSHVIEHVPNVIGAFLEWNRIIRPDGYVVMVVPQPNAIPQDTRPLTEWEKLLEAFREDYLPETAPTDEEYTFGGVYGHYHKFTAETMKGFVQKLRRGAKGRKAIKWELMGEEDPDRKVGNGFWLAYKVVKQ
jgi:SAM-dependent methyltransferase